MSAIIDFLQARLGTEGDAGILHDVFFVKIAPDLAFKLFKRHFNMTSLEATMQIMWQLDQQIEETGRELGLDIIDME